MENFPPGPSSGQGMFSSPSGGSCLHLLLFRRRRWVPWAGPAPCRAPDGSGTSRDCVCRRSVCHCLPHSQGHTGRQGPSRLRTQLCSAARLAGLPPAGSDSHTGLATPSRRRSPSQSQSASQSLLAVQSGLPGQTRPLTLGVTAAVGGPPANQSASQGRVGQPISDSPPITCVTPSSVFQRPIEAGQPASTLPSVSW